MRYRLLLGINLIVLLAVAASSSARAEEKVETKSQAVEPQAGAAAQQPLTPEEQALVSIQEQGQQRVAQVVQSMQGTEPGPAMEALQAQIVQIKTDTYVRFLTTLAGFARARGDEAAAVQAERIVEQVLHPQAPAEPETPQSPDKAASREGNPR